MGPSEQRAGATGAAREEIKELLEHGGWRLRFPASLESAFRDHHDQEAISVFRGSLAWLLLLYVVLGLAALVLGEWTRLGFWPLSFAGFGCVLLVGVLLSYTDLFQKNYQRVVGLLAMVAMALATLNPALIEEPSFRVLIHIGTVYTVMVVYLGLSLRLPWALLAGWGGGLPVLAAVFAAAMHVDWNMVLSTYVGASLLSAFLCYRDERQKRRLFLQAQLLECDRARIIELADRLEEMSMVDSLTGLANRRQFDEALAREWKRCQRERQPLALIFADVDRFKAYNDYYGHQRGDECLRQLAAVLANGARRPLDLAARYGGEEFVVLLPDTGPLAARQIAEALVSEVQALKIPHPDSDCAPEVTISAGVVGMVPPGRSTSDELVRLADEALYQAKQAGRNRVRVADSGVGSGNIGGLF